MEVPILIDDFRSNGSIEPFIRNLERLSRSDRDGDQPSIVKISGPVPHTSEEWVVEGLDWGELTGNRRGIRTRQAVTVRLMEYVVDRRLLKLSLANRARLRSRDKSKSRKAGQKTYVIRRGDTLVKIASRFLKDPQRWREISRLNGIRDPKDLKVGRRIKLP